MKKHITLSLLLFISSITLAQNISLSFENAEITNDGIDDFYEVDVLIESDADYIQGSGQFFLDYNTLAFGENIQASAGITYERPLTSILGSTTVSVENYNSFVVNDNIVSRVSFLWQQFWSSGAIGANNVTSVPAVLVHVKMKFIDSAQDPMVCFDADSHPAFNDQFFTACGPITFAGADCFNFPGTQIFDYVPDCAGAALMGCVATTIWDGTMWDNGTPDATTTAIINGNYTSSDVGLGSIDACEITVNTDFTLLIGDGDYLSVEGNITVEGTLDVLDQGSVVQIDDMATVTNNGSITVSKLTPVLGPKGFMILGSPMSGETREGVYGAGRRVLNHRTDLFVPNGAVGGTTENFVDDNNNNWEIKNGALTLAEGYLVKPQAPGNPPVGGMFNLDYALGTLNNGVINCSLLFNSTREDSPNMLGNPYASAIDLDVFLPANPLIDAVYYWQHITPPNQTFPGFNQLNFNLGDISVYNQGSGGVEAQNGGGIPTQYMASGQGFGVKALGMGEAIFNNSMRVTGPNTDYRSPENEDRQRIWLRLKSEVYDFISSSMLVAFTEGATDGFEGIFDSRRFDTPISLFSVLNTNEELAIQGRTAFNEDQEVQLGFATMVEEATNYSISISQIEGEDISTATVYLHDKVLNVMTNLSEANYEFTSNAVYHTDRFVLIFQEKVLGTAENSIENIVVYPNPVQNILNISSPLATITNIEIFDLSGRKIYGMPINYQTSYQIDMKNLRSSIYFVKINTGKGTITKKIIKE